MSNANILDKLIMAAKENGISQKQLAEVAGMSSVGLAKAKKRGSINSANLEKMAAILGLRLTLEAANDQTESIKQIKSGQFFTQINEGSQ